MNFNFILLIILICLSAFFSAAEIAFVSLTSAKVYAMVNKKMPRAMLIQKIKKNPRRLLITILVGNNVANIAAASLATLLTAQFFNSAVLGITTGIMTLLILFFGEIIPKSYGANHVKKTAIFTAPMLYLMQIIAYPIVITFEWLTNTFTGEHQADRVSREELKALVITGTKQGTIEEREGLILQRLFKFTDITCEDIMTPKNSVLSLKDSLSVSEAAELIKDNPHTRFPVIHESWEKIIGFAHSRDILLALTQGRGEILLKEITIEIIKVPKEMAIDDLLIEFQKKQVHMAAIINQRGETEGIATFKDVMEELVGEIADEHDVHVDDIIKRLSKYAILVSGNTSIRRINDFFHTHLPGDPFGTISELITSSLSRKPQTNEVLDFAGVKCAVEAISGNKITRIRIEKPEGREVDRSSFL
jgi:CBS domain containing-hemolysin-like protein